MATTIRRSPGRSVHSGAGRNTEAAWLAFVSVLISIAALAAFSAKSRDFGSAGQAVNLGAAVKPGRLTGILALVLPDPADARFATEKISGHLRLHGAPTHVGALAGIQVSEHEIGPAYPAFAQRMAGHASISLLTTAQIARIKLDFIARGPEDYRRAAILWTAVLVAGFWLVHLWWRSRRFGGDTLILPLVAALAGFGFLIQIGTRDALRDRLTFAAFAQGVAGGCVLLAILSRLDYERYFRKLSFVPVLAALALSAALVWFGSGPSGSDAKVNLGHFQPVEAVKILLVFFLAGYFSRNWEYLRMLKEKRPALRFLTRWAKLPRLDYYLPVMLCIIAVRLFFVLQRDLGPALILSVLFVVMYSVSCSRFRIILCSFTMIAAGFWISYMLGLPQTVRARLDMWLSPWDNTVRGGDQLAHGLWALASGGVFGSGPGLGSTSSIPAAHTDLVLAAAGEDFGFLGLLAIVGLTAALLRRGLRIARSTPADYSFFLALGLTALMGIQFLLIAGGVLGLIPLTGIVTPFLSYGRTAMLANFGIWGVLAALSAHPGSGGETRAFLPATRWIAGVATVLGLAALLRIADVQVFSADRYAAEGTVVLQADGARRYEYNPRLVEIASRLPRGSIYDRNGLPLATSEWSELAAHRSEYAGLGVDIDQACPRGDSRYYPLGNAAFYLLGDIVRRTNWTASNTAFAERDYGGTLQPLHVRTSTGLAGGARVVRYDYGPLVPLLRRGRAPQAQRANVHLSVEARLQWAAGRILAARLRDTGAQRGAIAMLDAASGEILASVSQPTPGGTQDSGDVLDRARFGLYPPGSTFKLVTAIAALRADPALASAAFSCRRLPDGGVGSFIPGFGRPVRDDAGDRLPHGEIGLEQALEVSCNAYFAQLAVRAGAPELHRSAGMFGISVARPNTQERLREILPQAGYGQGEVLATPVQIARVVAAIANNGVLVPVRFVRGAEGGAAVVTLLPRGQAELLALAMRSVVTSGTGVALRNLPVAVAGKTGTAEVGQGPPHGWFAGFATYPPGRGRTVAFAVLVEHGGHGAGSAAAIAGDLIIAARDLGILR